LKPKEGFDFMNPIIKELTGFTPEEIYTETSKGKGLAETIVQPVREKHSGHRDRYLRTIRWPCKDGTYTWVELFLFPVYNHRSIEAIEGMARDIIHVSDGHDDILLQIIISLTRVIEARDAYTAEHSKRLAGWAEATARRLNCSEEEVQNIRWGALLHDIGKISIPDSILRKAGPLNEEEWQIMKRHPVIGAEMVTPLTRLQSITPLIRYHQEWYNGEGYPDGLSGECIPLGARILSVVDAFGAMTDNRVYRRARSQSEASQELQRWAGLQFDAQVVSVFNQIIN
jgi:putative nucleotidyltransferase with HDIG domain/PAS domain S-box-containing protein